MVDAHCLGGACPFFQKYIERGDDIERLTAENQRLREAIQRRLREKCPPVSECMSTSESCWDESMCEECWDEFFKRALAGGEEAKKWQKN